MRKELGERKKEGGVVAGLFWREAKKLGKDKLRSLGRSESCKSLRLWDSPLRPPIEQLACL